MPSVDDEEWRDVIGYEGIYQVSNHGRVKRVASGAGTRVGYILKPYQANTGYFVVNLSFNGKAKQLCIHRLVCEAFYGPPPSSRHQVNHRNGKRTDNRISNLEWVTPGENNKHAYDVLGRKPPPTVGKKGAANSFAKLTSAQVIEIRRLQAIKSQNGKHLYSLPEIAKQFGVTRQLVWQIIKRKIWTHI